MNENGTIATPTVSLALPAATVARLREKAAAAGLPLERYLDKVADAGEPPPSRLEVELNWLANRTPADAEKALADVLAASRPPRPLPEGKTLADVVEGKWPGNETDEQVREALERLS